MDYLRIADLIFTTITTMCALYLAYAALKHTAKPNVRVRILSHKHLPCNEKCLLKFAFDNIGYWYAKPTAINVTVYFNFDPNFKLIELRYGSNQTYKDRDAKIGVGKMAYLKAKGLKLTYGEEGEEVHALVRTPKKQNVYRIRISAYSENGVSLKEEFQINCSYLNLKG